MHPTRFVLRSLVTALLLTAACAGDEVVYEDQRSLHPGPTTPETERAVSAQVQAPDAGFPLLPQRPGESSQTGVITATGTAAGGSKFAMIIRCVTHPHEPAKSVERPGAIVATGTVSCDAPVAQIYQQVGIYRDEIPVDSREFRNFGQSSIFGQVDQPFCQNATYKGGTHVQVVFPPGFNPPSASRTDYSNDVPITCGCVDQHPDLRICGGLPSGYVFGSAGAALSELKRRTSNAHLRLHNPSPTTSGPCVGQGTHYNVRSGSEKVASIACCPCCQDNSGGPSVLERCAIISSAVVLP
jgi:hypothetical protein